MNELLPILVTVVNAILLVGLPVLVVAGIVSVSAWGRVQWAKVKAMQPTLAEQVEAYARIGVDAAEQAGLKQLIADKKIYAVGVAARWLAQVGLNNIDVELIAAEVERQVGAMNKAKTK
jgi:hypothetical protein